MRFNFGGQWHAWGAGFGAATATYDSGAVGLRLLGVAVGDITFWDSQVAGNQYMDLLNDAGSSTFYITLNSGNPLYPLGGLPRFQGPDGVPVMYAEAGDAPRVRIVANDAYLYNQAGFELVGGLQTEAAALDTQVDAIEATRSSQNTTANNMATSVANLQAAQLRPAAVLRPSAVTTLTSSTWTTILFGAETIDTASQHSTSSQTGRFVCTLPGYYLFTSQISYAGSDVGSRYARYLVNGLAPQSVSVLLPANAISGSSGVTVPGRMQILALAGSDYVELQGHQTSGANLNTDASSSVYSFMSVVYLRPL
jgi:C1q domain-containing protein